MILQKGQALALILLVMSAVLVVGLSVASRSITSQSTSTQTERSQRAFSAAEAGIQEVLRRGPENLPQNPQGIGIDSLTFDGVTVDITATSIQDLPFTALKDEVTQVKLENSSGLDIRWGKSGDEEADLELIIVKGGGDMVKYYCDVAARVDNDNCGVVNPNGGFSHKFSLNGNPLANAEFIRIIPRYKNTTISVSGQSVDEDQAGFLVESTASTPDGIVRKIETKTTSLAVDQVFDYSLYSGAGL